jgi:hypothetical protein
MAAALALGLSAALCGAGCRSVETEARPLTITIESAPPAAHLAIAAGSGAPPRPLGSTPLVIDGLSIVRKTFVSGATDYWLQDGRRALPPNPRKPSYASPAYSAGNDYPYDLTLTASREGFEPATTTVRIDRSTLRRLFEERAPTLRVELRLEKRAAPSPAPPRVHSR